MKTNWISLLLMLLLATQSVWAMSDVHRFHHDTALDTAEHHADIHNHETKAVDGSESQQTDHHHHTHHHHSELQLMGSNWMLPELNYSNDLSAFYKTPKLSSHSANLFRPPRA